jgi:hypothetical protein
MSSIADALDGDYAPARRPAPGDKLVGVITDLAERGGYDGDPYPIVTVKQDDGTEFAWHAFHKVAQNELGKLRPSVGDPIGIKHVGKVQTGNGRGSYHSYRVRVLGGAKGINWSRYDGEPEPEGLPVEATPASQPRGVPPVEEHADDAIPF